jgi:hypothetical protein
MTSKAKTKRIYKVTFMSQGKVYELYARNVYQGNMYGFVEVEDLLFGEKTSLLVDPAEERLQNEFAGVQRSYIPIHTVIRIDEVEKEGISKVRGASDAPGNIAAFPTYPPGKGKDDKD